MQQLSLALALGLVQHVGVCMHGFLAPAVHSEGLCTSIYLLQSQAVLLQDLHQGEGILKLLDTLQEQHLGQRRTAKASGQGSLSNGSAGALGRPLAQIL